MISVVQLKRPGSTGARDGRGGVYLKHVPSQHKIYKPTFNSEQDGSYMKIYQSKHEGQNAGGYHNSRNETNAILLWCRHNPQ